MPPPSGARARSFGSALGLACLAAGALALELRSDSPSLYPYPLPSKDTADGHSSAFGWKSVRGATSAEAIHTDGQGYRQLLQNSYESQYVLYFSLGGQTLAGIVDTGSYELVVFSRFCQTCGTVARYDPTLSSFHTSSNMTTVQSYGSGKTTSKQAWDQLMIGPYKGVNQSFWEVEQAKMPVLMNCEFNAIVGIGPPWSSALTEWEKLRREVVNLSKILEVRGTVGNSTLERVNDRMMTATTSIDRPPLLKTTKEHMFSVCLGKESKSDGVFIWNDTSVALHPEVFHRVPVASNSSWMIEVQNARISHLAKESNDQHALSDEGLDFDNSTSISLGCEESACSFLLDSGTSLLVFPSTVIDKLLQELVVRPNIDCKNMSQLPYLVFEANGKTLSLPPDAYLMKAESAVPSYLQSFVRIRDLGKSVSHRNSDCELLTVESVAKGPKGPVWIMGMPFFRKYYTTFSLGQKPADSAIYLAGATEHCTPTHRRVEVHDGPADMWQRTVDPTKLWVPRHLMLASGFDQ